MSSYRNNGGMKRKLSDRESEIREQQRRVAARLVAPDDTTKKPPPSSKQAELLQKRTQAQKLQSVLQSSTLSKPADTRKRPTLRNRKPSPATTAEGALAAARSRLNHTNESKKSSTSASNTASARRKQMLLGSLVSATVQTASSAEPMEMDNYGQVDPEDYWRNIRDWDFLGQYCREVHSNKNRQAAKENDKKKPKQKPIPDTFISNRHYIATWAPLCLAENRAQLLSASLSKRSFQNSFFTVMVSTMKKHMAGASVVDFIRVQCRPKDPGDKGNRDVSFMANDIFVLVPIDRVPGIQHCMRVGDDERSFRGQAMVGHTEQKRRSVDGLQLKVSKRWYAKVHDSNKEEYGLLHLGNNVTALREFTALCRIDMLPVRAHLLGQTLQQQQEQENRAIKAAAAKSTTKAQMLMKMGGVNALGKGFTKYAQKKFNPSQMQAISAAAHEYGDGGFTLIKGTHS